jgi:trimeric autotransporter adhesin
MKYLILILNILLVSITTTYAQSVGINTSASAPAASAILDVKSNNKGILIPNVALTDLLTAAPIASSPAASLLVYNTATLGTAPNNVIPGYYFWNGSKWINLSGGTGGYDWSKLGNTGTDTLVQFIGTVDNQDLVFKANNTQALRLQTGTGNVGVNSTSPTEKLTIENGEFRIGEPLPAAPSGGLFSSGRLFFGQFGTNTDQLYFYKDYTASNHSDFNFVAGDNYGIGATGGDKFNVGAMDAGGAFNSIFTVLSNPANVGINVYNPTEALEILGSVKIRDGRQANYRLLGSSTATNGKGFWQTGDSLSPAFNGTAWRIIGNSATVPGTNYIGTNDNVDVVFKRNGVFSGLINATNTSFGENIFGNIPVGNNNTAFGTQSLQNIGAGNNNTAVGLAALQNTTGNDNSALGYNSGITNVTGSNNCFIGSNADALLPNLNNATAIGYNAKVGSSNTVIFGGTGLDTVSVGIGTAIPTRKIDVFANTGAGLRSTSESGFNGFELTSFGNTSTIPSCYFMGLKARGTKASSSYISASGNVLSAIIGRDALDGLTSANYGGAEIYMYSSQAYSATAKGSYLRFNVTANNSNSTLERMRIIDNGNVGINTTSPTQKLHIIGNILASGTITPSDIRYKQNIAPIENALLTITQLRGVTYTLKTKYTNKGFGNGEQIGVIAQEVQKNVPQLVTTNADGYLAVDYSKFTPLLIESIKTINTEVDKNMEYKLQLEQLNNDLNEQLYIEKLQDQKLQKLLNEMIELKKRIK